MNAHARNDTNSAPLPHQNAEVLLFAPRPVLFASVAQDRSWGIGLVVAGLVAAAVLAPLINAAVMYVALE